MTRARDVSNIDGLLTTKGDIYAATGAGVVVRQGVGSDGQVLTANSALDDGLEWATPAAGGGMTLLSTTTMSGSNVTVSSISQSYKSLKIVGTQMTGSSSGMNWFLLVNGNNLQSVFNSSSTALSGQPNTYYLYAESVGGANNYNGFTIDIDNYTGTSCPIRSNTFYRTSSDVKKGAFAAGGYDSGAITSITISASTDSFTAGTLKIYGVN